MVVFLNESILFYQKLLRDERLSLDDIVSSPQMEGLFDKWTWEGTGVFTLSLALPLTLKGINYLRQRHAINEVSFHSSLVNK